MLSVAFLGEDRCALVSQTDVNLLIGHSVLGAAKLRSIPVLSSVAWVSWLALLVAEMEMDQ